MPSNAAGTFETLANRVQCFQKIASGRRTSYGEAETLRHAALAAYVAAWEAYLEQLVREFYSITAKPMVPDFNAIHDIARRRTERAKGVLEKFNTPNFENSRALLEENTGYDPYSDWTWPRRSMSVMQVHERLNEILKVRHSFAHGFSIPRYSWNTLSSGRCGLNLNSIDMVEAFFNNLVRRTDKGMKMHIQNAYTVTPNW
ncbi:MAG TPA: HEPN domain-containing protein [Methylobacter sp.]|jgi:hypothetical protein